MKTFALKNQPVDYILTVHMNNLNVYLSRDNNTFKAEWEVYEAFGINAVNERVRIHIENLINTYGEASINKFFKMIAKKSA